MARPLMGPACRRILKFPSFLRKTSPMAAIRPSTKLWKCWLKKPGKLPAGPGANAMADGQGPNGHTAAQRQPRPCGLPPQNAQRRRIFGDPGLGSVIFAPNGADGLLFHQLSFAVAKANYSS